MSVPYETAAYEPRRSPPESPEEHLARLLRPRPELLRAAGRDDTAARPGAGCTTVRCTPRTTARGCTARRTDTPGCWPTGARSPSGSSCTTPAPGEPPPSTRCTGRGGGRAPPTARLPLPPATNAPPPASCRVEVQVAASLTSRCTRTSGRLRGSRAPAAAPRGERGPAGRGHRRPAAYGVRAPDHPGLRPAVPGGSRAGWASRSTSTRSCSPTGAS